MNKKKKPFLSLRWKALYLSGGLFFIIAVMYFFSGKAYLSDQFTQQRQNTYVYYQNEINSLSKEAAKQMMQLSGTVVFLDGISEAMVQKDFNNLKEVFTSYWFRFQLESGVDGAAIYFDDGRKLTWGIDVGVGALMNQVKSSNAPHWQVKCEQQCYLVTVTPITISADLTYYMVLLASFDDVAERFYNITKSDLVILKQQGGSVFNKINDLPAWEKELKQTTNDALALNLLKNLQEDVQWDDLEQKPQIAFVNGKSYEIALLDVDPSGALFEGQLVIITDVSAPLAAQQDMIRQMIVVTMIGLILTELILLAVLWTPIGRLNRVTRSLPLLAENKFDEVRKRFLSKKQSMIEDESDILRDTAVNLSYQLEALHSLLNNRAEQLESRSDELESERNFVLGLLDAAKALVLTQDSHGKILMLNNFGQSIFNTTEAEAVDSLFTRYLPQNPEQVGLVENELRRIVNGEIEEFQHDMPLLNKDESTRFMSWTHTRLYSAGDHKILTIGFDLSAQKQAEEHLDWLSGHDPLTGLFNRRRFKEELELIMAATRRFKHQGALISFDLDQFKDVNDTSGHQVGDEILRRVADMLRGILKEGDIAARLSGDEFALIIQDTDESEAEKIAELLCTEMMKIAVTGKERIHRITASIGIVLFPDHGNTVEALFANVDLAMHEAKEAGRNCWSFFDDDASGKQKVVERVFWNEKVKQVLTEKNFQMRFQPIFYVGNRQVSHYEALCRVTDENGDIMSPDKFISAAENGGQMHLIDEMIIERVIANQKDLQAQGNNAHMSINLSGLSFRNNNLIPHIEACLKQYKVAAESIIFEITETAAVADMEIACRTMEAIREMGCQFALDDFGVGFSSLHYLKRLPIDYVKIDGSFIRRIHEEPDDQVLVKALVEISRVFGLKTVAEFVDTEEALTMLEDLGVDYAQGYHLAKPQTFEQLTM